MRQCSQCLEWVQRDVLVCKHCHHRLTPDEDATAARLYKRTLVLRFVIIAAIVGGSLAYLSTDSGMQSLADWAAGV